MSVAEKLVTAAENVPKVYEAGQKSGYDSFWDKYQDNGERTRYYYGFSGVGWNDDSFKPKYDITTEGSALHMFAYYAGTDLIKSLENAGVVLDTSKATNLASLFTYAAITRIPTIDASSAVSATAAFSYCNNLVYIEKFVTRASLEYSPSMFLSCGELTDLTIEGTIGQNGFNVSYSPKLTTASLLSILTALSKDSTVASGKSITFAADHQAVIEGDAECLEQLNLAAAAGWSIAYA